MRPSYSVALATVVIALSALAPAASAGSPPDDLGSAGPIQYLRAQQKNVVNQAGVAVFCDPGFDLVGGGAAIGGSGQTGHLNSSGPIQDVDGWLGEGRSTSNPKTVTTWAMCGETPISRVSSSENVTGNTGQLNLSLQCPSGQLPTSPGITGSFLGDIQLFGLFPSAPAGWLNSFGNASPQPSSARLWSLCSSDLEVENRSDSKPVEAGRTVAVIARCRGNEAVAGGGVKVLRGTTWQQNVPALALRPWDSKNDAGNTPEDGYYVKTFNGTSRTVRVSAHAVCTPQGV